MIVCHRQGGASGGGDRKEAVTGSHAGTHQGEMITSVRRKQGSGERRLTHTQLKLFMLNHNFRSNILCTKN